MNYKDLAQRAPIVPAAGFFAGLGAGAGLMYLLDPDRGRSRRVRLEEQASSAFHDTMEEAGRTAKNLENRARGVVAKLRSACAEETPVPDERIEARVRSRLGRVASHPHAIHVEVRSGVATLTGPVQEGEAEKIGEAVRRVKSVQSVENKLEAKPEFFPGLDAGNHAAPAWRRAALLVGGAICGYYGVRK
jgi:hypothetical protein